MTKKVRKISEALFVKYITLFKFLFYDKYNTQRLHVFIGIFLVFENKLSRPLRFILYYLRIHQLLAISAIFSRGLDEF